MSMRTDVVGRVDAILDRFRLSTALDRLADRLLPKAEAKAGIISRECTGSVCGRGACCNGTRSVQYLEKIVADTAQGYQTYYSCGTGGCVGSESCCSCG